MRGLFRLPQRLHRHGSVPVAWLRYTKRIGRVSLASSITTTTPYYFGGPGLFRRTFGSSSDQKDHDPYDKYRKYILNEGGEVLHDGGDVWNEIQQENERTRRAIDPQLYEQVLDEMVQTIQRYSPETIPEYGPTGAYLYAYQGHRYCRKSASSEEWQTVVEDCSNLRAISLSVDEALVAYVLQEEDLIFVKHIASNQIIEIATTDPVLSLEMGPCLEETGRHSLFWVQSGEEDPKETQVKCCTIQPNPLEVTSLELIQYFTDPALMVHVQRTKGCQKVAIHAQTKTSNQIYLCGQDLLPFSMTSNQERSLDVPEIEGPNYHMDMGKGTDVYLLISDSETNTRRKRFELEYTLWKVDVNCLPLERKDFRDPNRMTQLAGPKDGFVIADMDVFQDCIALYERSTRDGSQRIRMLVGEQKEDEFTELTVPIRLKPCQVLSPVGNMHYEAQTVRFQIQDPITPPKTFEYNLQTGSLTLLSPNSGMNLTNIHKRKTILATSQDGTQVPLSILYNPERAFSSNKKTPAPTILFGYGSYGEPVHLSFNPSLQSYLDRGFVLAFARTRGGGDLGQAWYHGGRLHHKPKAIEDYIACAEALIKKKYTEPQQLTLKGYSAGGVLVGATANQRPDLFGSAVVTNGFLDVLATMQRPNLYLTRHEFPEWGNPNKDQEAAKILESYCPVANAGTTSPTTIRRFLLVGAFEDQEVPYWNALIYGKKLRQSCPKNQVWIHIEREGGHSLQLSVAAMEAAFLIGGTKPRPV